VNIVNCRIIIKTFLYSTDNLKAFFPNIIDNINPTIIETIVPYIAPIKPIIGNHQIFNNTFSTALIAIGII